MIQPLITGTNSELEQAGIIPAGQYALCVSTGVLKQGSGGQTWSKLATLGATMVLPVDGNDRLLSQATRQHVHTLTALTNDTATAVHAAITLTAATQTVTTGITNPDFYRAVSVKGNAAGNAGNVTVIGTDPYGNVVSDTIALSGSSEVAGVIPMMTVTAINLPIQTHAGTDTVSIGKSNVFGIPRLISAITDVITVERIATGAWAILTGGGTDYTVNATNSTIALTTVAGGDVVRFTYQSLYL